MLTSPTAKKKASKAKSRAFQPKKANIQALQVSVLDRLGLANTDLREYLSNKQKLHSEDPIHVSLS